MTSPKEFSKVRYAYGVAAALLIGGSAFSIATGPVGAQVAQNAPASIAPRPGAPMSFADLSARLQPAVVNISTRQRVPVRAQADPLEEFFRRFGGQAPQEPGGQQPRTRETGSLGSGFIISPDGYVVTNNHLIQGAGGTGTVDQVTVTLPDRREFTARIIGRDQPSDLALLKIEGRNLPYVNWGDSTRVRVGDWVIAIGNPYGLGGTVTIAGSPALAPTTAISRRTQASTWAIPAARCSTSTAMLSGSTRRLSRRPAPTSASALPFRRSLPDP